MIKIIIVIAFWWTLIGLITNIITEHLWKKKHITKADLWRLIKDMIRGPIGFGIYLYYLVTYLINDFNKFFKDQDYD